MPIFIAPYDAKSDSNFQEIRKIKMVLTIYGMQFGRIEFYYGCSQ